MNLIVDVQAKDLDRAVRFYTEVLGLKCRIQADDWAGIVVGKPCATEADPTARMYINARPM